MKTKLEIIKETVAYYSEDTSRRAIGESYDYISGDAIYCHTSLFR